MLPSKWNIIKQFCESFPKDELLLDALAKMLAMKSDTYISWV
jgi:hypothetical protein